ncbi:MAG TPA: S-layer homology domain-containing protein [Firmicutes bacterium]|nr:S-layer homology domain-containing protein [Candidatus Fermentithermobacillaceae bacterium]
MVNHGRKRVTFEGHRRARRLGFLPLMALVLALTLVVGESNVAEAKAWGRLKNAEKMVKKLLDRAGNILKEESDLRFSDLQGAEWALGAISRLRGLGIITGYDGNVFKPNNPVTQAEALTMMVKAFGLEDEAEEIAKRFGGFYAKLDENDGDDDDEGARFLTSDGTKLPYVPAPTRWALGYVLLAVDQGWVDISEIQPQKPASREWIAKVMVRALGYTEEAESKMDASLPFSDAAAISRDAWGYVAQAIEIGLFEGYPDNTFRPQKPVTRAEMAAILDRFINEELPDETPYHVEGRVSAVSGSSITVKLASGREVTYRISPDALIVFGKTSGTVSDIHVGDRVQVLSNGQGVALLIVVKNKEDSDEGEIKQYRGKIVEISTDSEGDTKITVSVEGRGSKTFKLSDDCEITGVVRDLGPDALSVGDQVIVEAEGDVAVRVTVISSGSVSGEVYGVIEGIALSDGGVSLSVQERSGKTYSIRLRADVRITYGTLVLAPEDLAPGDWIVARLQNNLAYQIAVTSRAGGEGQYILGVVREVSLTGTGTTLKVEDRDGHTYSVRLASNVRVIYGGSVLTPSQIGFGDTVRLRIEAGTCVEVHITARYEGPKTVITGVIVTVSTGTQGVSITVKQDDGREVTLRVAENARITYGQESLDADELSPGDKVEVRIQNQEATEVQVRQRGVEPPFGDLGGSIVSISHSTSGTVIVVDDNGVRYTVPLSAQVKITYGTQELRPTDLRIGDAVRIKLQNQVAVELRITKRG